MIPKTFTLKAIQKSNIILFETSMTGLGEELIIDISANFLLFLTLSTSLKLLVDNSVLLKHHCILHFLPPHYSQKCTQVSTQSVAFDSNMYLHASHLHLDVAEKA